MTKQHNYEHTVTFSVHFSFFSLKAKKTKEKETEFVVLLFWEKVPSVHLLTHMKQEAFWVTIYVAMFNITNGSTTEMSVKIGLLKIKF